MASVINPDNDEYIVKGSMLISGEGSQGKLRIKSTADVDLTDIPTTFEDADAALVTPGGAWMGGNLYVAGTITSNGDVISLGNADQGVVFNGNIASDLLPTVTGELSVGSELFQWQTVQTQVLNLNSTPHLYATGIEDSQYSSIDHVNQDTPAQVSLSDGTQGQVKTIVCIDDLTTPVEVAPENCGRIYEYSLDKRWRFC